MGIAGAAASLILCMLVIRRQWDRRRLAAARQIVATLVNMNKLSSSTRALFI